MSQQASSSSSCWDDCASAASWLFPSKLLRTLPTNEKEIVTAQAKDEENSEVLNLEVANSELSPLPRDFPPLSPTKANSEHTEHTTMIDDQSQLTSHSPSSQGLEGEPDEDFHPRQSISMHPYKPKSSLMAAFTSVVKEPIDDTMFEDNANVDEKEVEETMSRARKSPRVLLGWKIELLEGTPYRDVRIVCAIEKLPFQHSMFCLFSLLGADDSQSPEIDQRPPEREWVRLKREKEGRPFKLLQKVV